MAIRNEHKERSQCPIACGLDLVGDHWTLLIVRDLLMFDRHEFSELLNAEEGISTNILSDRLRRLQEQGLVDVIDHPDSRRRRLYFLTEKGKGLIHVIVAIVGWSATWLMESPPPEVQARLDKGPRQFVRETLKRLSRWEAEMGIQVD